MVDSSAITEISRQRIALLYPGVRPLAYRVLQDMFISTKRVVNVAQSTRSVDDQQALYAKGREQNADGSWKVVDLGAVVTNAKPGLSWHSYGLAFDVSCSGADPYLEKESEAVKTQFWKQYGLIGKAYGMRWGGDFHLINGVKDLPHLEMTYGLTIEQALELSHNQGIKSVWAYLDTHRGVPVGQDWGLS